MRLHQLLLETFRQRFGADPEFVAYAPGRVNLLGEHLDYNDGFVLPAAIDRTTLVAFRRSGSQKTTLRAIDLQDETSFDLRSIINKHDTNGASLSHWALYPAGVMWSLNAEGLETPGLEAVFTSNVPIGAGLSSSASIEVAFSTAWAKLGGWSIPFLQLAMICQKAETNYVGVKCGIMDQFASACGIKGCLLLLDCRSLEWRTLPLPKDALIVIADTSLRRSLTNSAYNNRRATCEEAVRILKGVLPGIQSLRDVTLDQFHRVSGLLPEAVAKKARYIVEEIARTQQVIELLEDNDVVRFGELMNASHAGLRDLYEVSCPELDLMVSLAQSFPGCYGARLTGAGFGGCTVNLVARQVAESFTATISSGYQNMTGLKPEIFICNAVGGAGVKTVLK